MPALIAQRAKQTFFIPDEESLGEILGHSDFDGFPFSVGDQIIFEDGTGARVEHVPGHQFHVWTECVPITMRDVLGACRALEADLPAGASDAWSFAQFFEALAGMHEPRRPLFRGRWVRK